jgi:hypothetical protein
VVAAMVVVVMPLKVVVVVSVVVAETNHQWRLREHKETFWIILKIDNILKKIFTVKTIRIMLDL